jgi:hypothetical protein
MAKLVLRKRDCLRSNSELSPREVTKHYSTFSQAKNTQSELQRHLILVVGLDVAGFCADRIAVSSLVLFDGYY